MSWPGMNDKQKILVENYYIHIKIWAKIIGIYERQNVNYEGIVKLVNIKMISKRIDEYKKTKIRRKNRHISKLKKYYKRIIKGMMWLIKRNKVIYNRNRCQKSIR